MASLGSTVLLLLLLSAVLPLPQPQNVKMDSFNMGAILRWDEPCCPVSSLTYTAKYRMFGKNTTEHLVCQSIEERQCDFAQLPSYHGHYKFSVRTEQGSKTSKWATVQFSFDRMTTIGAPSVTLTSRGGAIEVNIQDPVLRMSSLREVYSKVSYRIRHWSKDHPEDGQDTLTVGMSWDHVLRPLVPNTEYCARVSVFIHDYSIRGQDSNATCEMSSVSDAESRWSGKLLVSLVVVAVAVPLMLLVLWAAYKGTRFLNPREPLPERFKQHLLDCPEAQQPSFEKFDLICDICEEPRYHTLTLPLRSEVNPALEDSRVSMETSGYYNVIGRTAFEEPYQNPSIDT